VLAVLVVALLAARTPALIDYLAEQRWEPMEEGDK
jgi:hypothetical protein